MTPVHRVFFMHLGQPALVVVNFLPETQGVFRRIDVFQIAGAPAEPSVDLEPLTAAAPGSDHCPVGLELA